MGTKMLQILSDMLKLVTTGYSRNFLVYTWSIPIWPTVYSVHALVNVRPTATHRHDRALERAGHTPPRRPKSTYLMLNIKRTVECFLKQETFLRQRFSLRTFTYTTAMKSGPFQIKFHELYFPKGLPSRLLSRYHLLLVLPSSLITSTTYHEFGLFPFALVFPYIHNYRIHKLFGKFQLSKIFSTFPKSLCCRIINTCRELKTVWVT